MNRFVPKTVALVVAHPDDETLWAGGTILIHPLWQCFVLCLCRGSDADRSRKFQKALMALNAQGCMADLDDSPDLMPLDSSLIERTIMENLPHKPFDLLITHSPRGEYVRHIRHEETGRAVISLWQNGKIVARQLRLFAYGNAVAGSCPVSIAGADLTIALSKRIWQRKYFIITEIYGFSSDSWEALTTPKSESFWQLNHSRDAENWLINNSNKNI